MRTLVILVWTFIVLGCSPTGSINADGPDAGAIKLPPSGKPGGDSAPGCDGVPVSGTCQDGVAVYCDSSTGSVRQVDCRALGQTCTIDPDNGAACSDLGNQPGNPPGNPDAPCGGTVTEAGYCSPEGVAVWCDAGSNQVVSWNCGSSGLACAVDNCADGAYCCDDGAQNECPALGFYGECQGDVARYCNSSDTLIELDCAAQGKVCALDECATGAYCCAPPQNVCDVLGTYGECGGPSGNTVRYCLNGSLREYECTTAGESCMLDVCFNGAECCTQAEYDATCQSLGARGTCGGPDDNVATYCVSGEIRRNDCTAEGKTCSIDVCGPGAWCC